MMYGSEDRGAISPPFESRDDAMTSGWGITLGKDEVENGYVVFGGLEKKEGGRETCVTR